MAEVVGIIVYFASPVLIAAFNSDPGVVEYGVREAHVITLFYFLLGVFSLYCRTYARSGKSHSSHVCYAGMLVRDPCYLYYNCSKDPSGDPDCVLGISADLVP